MNKYALIFIHIACAFTLLWVACKSNPEQNKLKGNWSSKNGSKLKITDKKFTMDDEEAEDYFVKGDTIFTSFEGNLPYTKFVLQKIDEHVLKIIGPDSVAMEYNK